MTYKLSPEAQQKLRAEMEYRETLLREFESSRPKEPWWKKISGFFGHAFIVSFLGGSLLLILQANQAAKQERLTRQEQLQDKQYALLANFSNELDQYTVLLVNLRFMQIFLQNAKPIPNTLIILGVREPKCCSSIRILLNK